MNFQIKEFEGEVTCPRCAHIDCFALDRRGRMYCGNTGHFVTHASLVRSAMREGLKPRQPDDQAAYSYMPLEFWESDPIEMSRWRVVLLNGSHRRTLYRCLYKGPTEVFLHQFLREFKQKPGNSVIKTSARAMGADMYRLCQDHGKTFFGNVMIEKIESE